VRESYAPDEGNLRLLFGRVALVRESDAREGELHYAPDEGNLRNLFGRVALVRECDAREGELRT
jgi:hypothetical protein